MPAKLYAIHGSHPCRAVARAMRLKGVDYQVVELMPTSQVVVQRLVFGAPTVPGVRFENGEKVQGSVPIMRRLEAMRPDPPLYPDQRRAEVEEAERWGDEEFQAVARRILWYALKHNPDRVHSYQEGGKRRPLPRPVVRALAPAITRFELGVVSRADDAAAERDLRELPGHLDRIDRWLADGLLGGESPNAADLQIATSLRLLMTLEDVARIADARPCGAWARRLCPDQAGTVPAGALSVAAV